MDRRQFLQLGLSSSMLLGLGAGQASARSGRRTASNFHAIEAAKGQARHVIFLVSDGMSTGTLTAADQYLHWRDGRHTHWMKLYRQSDQPIARGLMDMSSRDNMVTDSGAAAASWGCGHRVDNNAINIGPRGEEYPTILDMAGQAGKMTALVTTTHVTHATPAGFAANVVHRNREDEIAEQYYARGYDIMLGGGSRMFDPDERDDGKDLFSAFQADGYAIARKRDELLSIPQAQRRILGTFHRWHVPYELDRLNDEQIARDVPTLAEMTRVALDRLEQAENGFVVQIEGGRVDHGAHGNDIGALLFDQLAFDEAIGVALEFQQRHPDDTLIIVTTDHGNANPGFQSGPGRGGRQFDRISRFTGTHRTKITPEISEGISREKIRELFKRWCDIDLSDREVEKTYQFAHDEYRLVYDRMNRAQCFVGQVIANHLDFNWIGNAHSADYVELVALGPGSEMVRPFILNTDLHHVMVQAMGIEAQREAAQPRAAPVFA